MQGWPGIHGEEGLEWARAKQFRPFPEFFFPQALSSLELVITSFPFFSRPKSLRLGDTWHFHPPERYYKRVALEVLLCSSQPLIGPQEALRCRGGASSRAGRDALWGPGAAKQVCLTGGGMEAQSAYPGWTWLHRPLKRHWTGILHWTHLSLQKQHGRRRGNE